MKYVLALMTVLGVMAVGVTYAQASTVCFKSKAEARLVSPNSKVYYTSIKKNGNDHIDFFNAGPIGSKCYHTHQKLPSATHLPREENFLASQEFFWNHIYWWEPPQHPSRK